MGISVKIAPGVRWYSSSRGQRLGGCLRVFAVLVAAGVLFRFWYVFVPVILIAFAVGMVRAHKRQADR